ALSQYAWPGNIREMENLIERAVILSAGATLAINFGDLRLSTPAGSDDNGLAEAVTLDDAERQPILRTLRAARWGMGGPKGEAARLAMKRTTLQSKMKRLGISRPE